MTDGRCGFIIVYFNKMMRIKRKITVIATITEITRRHL